MPHLPPPRPDSPPCGRERESQVAHWSPSVGMALPSGPRAGPSFHVSQKQQHSKSKETLLREAAVLPQVAPDAGSQGGRCWAQGEVRLREGSTGMRFGLSCGVQRAILQTWGLGRWEGKSDPWERGQDWNPRRGPSL